MWLNALRGGTDFGDKVSFYAHSRPFCTIELSDIFESQV